ncbi:C-C motif chemokine 3-like [Trichomycterus rosablanca]|uniref:C-C motif chemokine 3-like n=1 Tax=Trichomycterus rosablanca TaxID=2290929 RepID=UPI002F35740C
MFYRAGSLLLVLLVLGCLQTFTQAENGNGPTECCFSFFKHPIPVRVITAYKETRPDCTKPGLIFTLTNGKRLCAAPGVKWVKRCIEKIDKRLLGVSS